MSRVKGVSQRRPRAPQSQGEPSGLNRPPLDFSRDTYLTVREAMQYLKLPTPKAVYNWTYRRRVPRCHAGGLRFLKRDLDKHAQESRHQEVL